MQICYSTHYLVFCFLQASIREICFRINEIFQIFLQHKQDREREEELEQQQEAAVKPVMLRRLSTSHGLPLTKEDTAANTSGNRGKLSEQVDRQFSNLIPQSDDTDLLLSSPTPLTEQPSKDPPIGQPRIKRVSRDEVAAKKVPAVRQSLSSTYEDSDEEDVDMMMPVMVQPPSVQEVRVAKHDGGSIQHQKLEDTSNVIVGDRLELLQAKGKSRRTIEDIWDTSSPVEAPLIMENQPRQSSNATPKKKSIEVKPRSITSPNELLALRVRTLLLDNFK